MMVFLISLKFVFSNPSLAIDFNDDFIPSVEDVDESMFTFESAVIPNNLDVANNDVANDNPSSYRFVAATTIRRSEAFERWATRSFDD
jgi:hypothetical protein